MNRAAILQSTHSNLELLLKIEAGKMPALPGSNRRPRSTYKAGLLCKGWRVTLTCALETSGDSVYAHEDGFEQ